MSRPNLVCLYDDQDRFSKWWRLGQKVNRTRRDVPATTWTEAYERLAAEQAAAPVTELHVWGHGAPGKPLIARRQVNLSHLQEALPDLQLVWWRSCNVHKGTEGHAFVLDLAGSGIISVGHTEVISAPLFWRQKAVCAYTPQEYMAGHSPWWRERDTTQRLRGCSTFRMDVPRFAYRDDLGF